MIKWNSNPTEIKEIEPNVGYYIFFDENNTDSIKRILKKTQIEERIDINERYFTLTACIIQKDEYQQLKSEFERLKLKYWKDGKYFNKKKQTECKVCFHSQEIRRGINAFSPKKINKIEFIEELFQTIQKYKFNIISFTIDIYEYLQQNYEMKLYYTATINMLQKIQKYLPQKSKAIIIFEARGKKEDKDLYSYIKQIFALQENTELLELVQGVYFNPKWNKEKTTTYAGLELVDLCSYPIHKYMKTRKKDKVFSILEKKIWKYPQSDKGMELFPIIKKQDLL